MTAIQSPAHAEDMLQFNRLSHIDGLLHDNVTSIVQDSTGFMWFGTHRGLNRYDGYRIDSYKYDGDDINSIYYNRIYSMARQGDLLWLATEAGLACFDTNTKEFLDYKVNSVNNDEEFYSKARYVAPDDNGKRIWILSGKKIRLIKTLKDDSGVSLKYVKIGNSNCFESEGLNPRVVSDNEGRVWFSGDQNIEAYHEDNTGNLIYTGEVAGVNGYNIRALLRDNGTLWIAYNDRILKCEVLEDGMLRPGEEISIPTSVGINSIAVDPQNLWVAAQDGLFCLPKENPHDFTMYHSSSSDPRSIIRDINNIYIDDCSNVWLSGWESGVAYASPMSGMFGMMPFPSYSDKNASEFVSAIHCGQDGYIYVGSKFGGLGRIKSDTREADWDFCHEPVLLSNNIPSIADTKDKVFVAIDNGVQVVDKSTGKILDYIPTQGGGYIFWITFDKFGRIWLATYAGLECFDSDDKGKWQPRYLFRAKGDSDLRLSTDMLHNICSDTVRNELIVTSAVGINRVIMDNTGEVKDILTYTASMGNAGERLSSNYLWPIAKAPEDGVYWVGSMGSGLNKVKFNDDGTYTARRFGKAEGAVSDDIESIELDRFGRVWCAGPGLGYFDENIGRFKFYDISDGLQGNLFGTSSAAADRNGALWFGGSNGLNYFIPTREASAPIKAGVIFSLIESGKEILKDLRSRADITLEYPDNNFKVDFSTLSYATTNLVRYRYRLDGYDKDWHYIRPGELPQASYTNLPPHKKLKLIVEAGDWQDWSGVPTVLTINSKGPWWSSWWAIVIYIILSLTLIATLSHYFINWTRMKQAIAIRRDKEEQQKEMMQMKMRFFTDVSHEFRTPLTLIRHAAGELQHHTADNERYVRIISRNAGVLTNMVNELLDFHRADMKSTPLRTTLTSVNPLINAIVEEFKGWAEDSGIDIELHFDENNIEMWLDREQFSKVLSNIISNSIRYSEGKGHIEINVSTGLYQDVSTAFPNRVSLVSAMVPGKQLIVKILDSGIGIPADSLPIIFERFKQTPGNSKTSSGSGIGLSLVKYLIDLHQGGIVASSEEGVGTEIIIFIPMTYDYLTPDQKIGESVFDVKDYLNTYEAEYEKVGTRLPSLQEDKEGSEHSQTIMVVDDNLEILDLLYDFFSKDYDVVVAKDAGEALEKASKKLPDLIISDIMMPGMDGMEFCRKMKNDLRTCHIPVVLLTAMAHEENRIEGIETGADAYIAKPFNPRLLTATVKNLLARNNRQNSIERDSHKEENTFIRQEILDKKERDLFERFEALVKDNFTNPDYTVDDIWKDLNINRTRLYTMVKDTTGISMGNYIKKLRLEKASELLLTTDLSVAEVAYNVGIESHAYFTRSFRLQYGMSPTEWIKYHRNKETK